MKIQVVRCELCAALEDQKLALRIFVVAHEMMLGLMPLELLIVPIHLVLGHIDILRLECLLLAQFLAQLAEVMRRRIMLVQRILVV